MDEKYKKIYESCHYYLSGHQNHVPRPMKEIFQELADYIDDQNLVDTYGESEFIQNFETKIAKILRKESAIFLPSGTMAQQIALRIWCEKNKNFKVAFHPTAHLEIAEHMGYSFLHNMKRVPFGAPESVSNRVLTLKDFQNLPESISAVLLELPQRPLGGQLPTWEELGKIREWAKENNIKLHLDGARIWECRSYYGKSYGEICQFFDSVYVSFYKGLGGLTGAILAGEEKFISEAKIWRKRHGGSLYKLFPYVVSAKLGLERHLEKMELYFSRTKEIVQILDKFENLEVVPNPPQVNMFHLIFRGDDKIIKEIHLELAKKHKTWLFHGPGPTSFQKYSRAEIYVGENALKVNLDTIEEMFGEISEKI